MKDTNTFTSIVRKEGNGAVFELDVDDGESVNIEGATFDGCETSAGYGGAMYITVDEGSSLTMKSLTFKNCKS